MDLSAESCRLCAEPSAPEASVCVGCERLYGPRVARLLARAERDRDFASACLAHLAPPLRERFASLLAQRYFLPGADTKLRPGLRSSRPRACPKWLRAAN